MATSMASQSSSVAPTDFKVCTSFDESNGAISVAVEHCQLCGGNRRTFYCKDCVQLGAFTHSKCRLSPERYEDKVNKWNIMKKELLKLTKRIEKALLKRQEVHKKKTEVEFAKGRIALLQKASADCVQKMNKDKELLTSMRERSEARRAKSAKHDDKKRRICKYIDQAQTYLTQRHGVLQDRLEALSAVRRRHMSDLLQYIYTMEEIKPKICGESDSVEMSTVSALAEARQTSYIRGRWVYTENAGELQYRIVEPTLPGNGDYSAYNLWLMENKESQGKELNQRNPANTISAGLSYSIHLVSLLAFFLDVNLPRKLCFSELCGVELSEGHFNRAVNALNHNVLHLCFTQDVNPEELNPRHTVQNINLLLKAPHLGRCGWFQVNPELLQSLEEDRAVAAEDGSMSDISSEGDGSDGAGAAAAGGDPDWEQVPATLPELDIPVPPTYDSRVLSIASGTKLDAAASAGGLISSVASFWRVATGKPN